MLAEGPRILGKGRSRVGESQGSGSHMCSIEPLLVGLPSSLLSTLNPLSCRGRVVSRRCSIPSFILASVEVDNETSILNMLKLDHPLPIYEVIIKGVLISRGTSPGKHSRDNSVEVTLAHQCPRLEDPSNL